MQTVPLFAQPMVRMVHQGDGSVVLGSGVELGPYARSVAELFRTSAEAAPGRTLAAQRDGDTWRRVTYARARALADRIAQGLLDRGLADRPVMVLSGNSIEHLLLTLACHTIGTPLVPVSTAYSLADPGHARLRAVAELVEPGLAVADGPQTYEPALRVLADGCPTALLTPGPAADTGVPYLPCATPTAEVEERYASVGPDTVAKILLTSGSTGTPKGVLTTHRMLCANQQMLRQVWPFLEADPPVLLDWLPWSHTFGGSHNLNLVLANAGTLYIDDGRPGPLTERTVRNLADISPTVYFNVPAGYAGLVPALEADSSLAARFFRRLRFVFFAGSALPQELWDRIERVATSAGCTTPMTTSWGATETAPAATSAHFVSGRSDCIGVPLPGVLIKLAQVASAVEIRVKGPNVAAGYHRRPDLTTTAFDEQGFYRTGDAGALIDKNNPNAGLRFDGRIGENFKLSTGTWVIVGDLRRRLLDAGEGLIQDAIITGHDRDYIGGLIWLNPVQARQHTGADGDLADGPLYPHTAVTERLRGTLTRVNSGAAGSSRQIIRLLAMAEPPTLGAGEITDKGYVNQRAVLHRRRALVERLHADPPPKDVVVWETAAREPTSRL